MSEAPVPDVSFVIAAYNARETIGRAIDSALAQTGITLEVVVVDDCSSDGTAELVRYFGDPRVRLVEMAQNGGPGAARNAGIDAALGRWIAVLDSDDAVRPERSAAMIATAARLGAEIVVDNLDVAKPGEPVVTMFAREDLQQRPLLTLADFIGSNVIFRSTFNFGYMKPMFSRAFLNEQGLRFDPSLRIGEDYLLLASALASGGRCAVEPGVGYIYHIREGSISRVLEPRHVEAMIAADRGFVARFPLEGEARRAQARRTRSLIEAGAFLMLVGHIKQRSLSGCLGVAVRHPAALRHLKMPIAARLRRFFVSNSRRPARASF
ncbi:glycosyltransferase family 2 protein [Rhizobium straminoryzae]|uniref:Glycosyltransferase family 2 protein n=1 Tax=Rhizobium straminoryzae TaxID=1387186 RepID=A0A549TAE9_9HYPH|nr:glycosyltransferase family 2 protein [Rhizobium straminoryzae]TRL38825.1 glycosyltransferase family 2 protein [Rhizobium straminoryzae]